MKDVVFTEFIEFVEEQFGFEAVDGMIENSGISGVYYGETIEVDSDPIRIKVRKN